jgi:hypothetical protein
LLFGGYISINLSVLRLFMKTNLTLILIFCLFQGVSLIHAESSSANKGFNIYQGTGYQISFPEKWQVMRGAMGADLVGLEPYGADVSKPNPSVAIYIENRQPRTTEQEIVEVSQKALETALGVTQKIVFSENNSFAVKCYEARYPMVKGKYSASNRVLMFFKNDKVFSITASLPTDTHVENAALIERILNSFEIQN